MDDSPLSWQDDAKCAQVGGDIWFAEKHDWATTQRAREICEGCPVRQQCFEYGLHEQFGVYAGTTNEDRKKIRANIKRRTRGKAATA